jgi:hypothetical protein
MAGISAAPAAARKREAEIRDETSAVDAMVVNADARGHPTGFA